MATSWPDPAREAGDGVNRRSEAARLDDVARIAARLYAVPIGLVIVAGGDSPHARDIIGQIGLPSGPQPGLGSFYTGVLDAVARDGGVGLVLGDASHDPRFARHPMVTGAPCIRFFAGVPIFDGTETPIGIVCVIDTAPRETLHPGACDDLQTLAAAAAALVAQNLGSRRSAEINRRFETLADALPQLVWSSPDNGLSDYFSRQWCEFTGAPASASFGTGWLDFVHPDDVSVAREAWQGAVGTGRNYTVEYRLLHADGSYRWMLALGLPVTDDTGRITRWIGTCTDIDERVRTGDLLEFMSRELTHRIKNMFAVVQGLIAMALRKHPGMADVSQSLQSRMVALGRAHDVVRPRVTEGAMLRSQTTLSELIRLLVVPYVQDDPTRLDIVGDDTVIKEHAATPLALFFHEMALNSARFGGLSTPLGRVRVAIALGETLTVEWKESGGPMIAVPPKPAFGLSLTKLTVERQLGGTLTMDWQNDGLLAVACIPLPPLTAE